MTANRGTILPQCQLASDYAEKRFDAIDVKLEHISGIIGDLREFKGEIRAKVTFQATMFGILGGAIPVIAGILLKYGVIK